MLDPVSDLVLGVLLVALGGAVIIFRRWLVDMLLLFVQWADTAWGRTYGPPATAFFGVFVMIMGLGSTLGAVTRL